MKYIKKPIPIDAIQWNNDAESELKIRRLGCDFSTPGDVFITIITPEGAMTGNQGDYVIKGIKGEFYICRKNIFEESYTLCID